MWLPGQGRYCSVQVPPLPAGPAVLPGGAGFTLNGTTYRVRPGLGVLMSL